MIDYPIGEILTKKVYTEKKPWLERYIDKVNKGAKFEASETIKLDSRLVIDQECTKCESKKMYYSTMQTRSADEGATVIYECVECGYFIFLIYLSLIIYLSYTEKVNN